MVAEGIVFVVIYLGYLGYMCWLLFRFRVYTLPFGGAVLAALAADYAGAGHIGYLIATLAFVVGRTAMKTSRLAAVAFRLAIMLLLVVGVGYFGTLYLLRWLGIPSVWWQQVLAELGAVVFGGTALIEAGELLRLTTRMCAPKPNQ
jgi:hypothetical protein